MLLSATAGSFMARCFVCSGVTGDDLYEEEGDRT